MAPLAAVRGSWDREQVRVRQERVWLRKLREMSPEKAEAAWRAHVEEAVVNSKRNFGSQSSFHADGELPSDITAARGFLPPEVLASPVRLLRIGEVLRWRALPAYEHVEQSAYLEMPYTSTTDALWDTVCVVSWRWSQPVPAIPMEGISPMPDEQFARFLAALRKVPGDRAYLWIDWCCAPQYSEDPGVEVVRSKLFFHRAATLVVVPEFKPVTPRAMLKSLFRPLSASPVRKLERQLSRSAPGSSMEAAEDMLSYSPRSSSGSGGGVIPQWSPSSHTAPTSPFRDTDSSEGGRDGSGGAGLGSALQHVVVNRYSDDLSQPSTPTGQYTVLSLENSPAGSARSTGGSGHGVSYPGSSLSPSESDSLASQARAKRREEAQQQDPFSPSTATEHNQDDLQVGGGVQPRNPPALVQTSGDESERDGAAYSPPKTGRDRRASGADGSLLGDAGDDSSESPPALKQPKKSRRPGSASGGSSRRQRSSRKSRSGKSQQPSPSSPSDETRRAPTESDNRESDNTGHARTIADASLSGQSNDQQMYPGQQETEGSAPKRPASSSSLAGTDGQQADVLVVDQGEGETAAPKLYSQMSVASSVGDLPDKNEALFRLFTAEGEDAATDCAGRSNDPSRDKSKKVFNPEQSRPRTGAMRASVDDGGGSFRQATPVRERPNSGRTDLSGKPDRSAPSFDPATLRPTVVQPATDDVTVPSTAAPSWVGKVTASAEMQLSAD